jgi:hypothetical protein
MRSLMRATAAARSISERSVSDAELLCLLLPALFSGHRCSAERERRAASRWLQHGGRHSPVGVDAGVVGDRSWLLRRPLSERGGEARRRLAARADGVEPATIHADAVRVSRRVIPIVRRPGRGDVPAATEEMAETLAVAADGRGHLAREVRVMVVPLVLTPANRKGRPASGRCELCAVRAVSHVILAAATAHDHGCWVAWRNGVACRRRIAGCRAHEGIQGIAARHLLLAVLWLVVKLRRIGQGEGGAASRWLWCILRALLLLLLDTAQAVGVPTLIRADIVDARYRVIEHNAALPTRRSAVDVSCKVALPGFTNRPTHAGVRAVVEHD